MGYSPNFFSTPFMIKTRHFPRLSYLGGVASVEGDVISLPLVGPCKYITIIRILKYT